MIRDEVAQFPAERFASNCTFIALKVETSFGRKFFFQRFRVLVTYCHIFEVCFWYYGGVQ